jgi:hypothetical protein
MKNMAISPITAQIIEFPFKSLFDCQFFCYQVAEPDEEVDLLKQRNLFKIKLF